MGLFLHRLGDSDLVSVGTLAIEAASLKISVKYAQYLYI